MDIEALLSGFLDDFPYQKDVVGILCGKNAREACVTGTSDIDVHLILTDDCNFQRKGLWHKYDRIVSYAAYPERYWYQLVEKERYFYCRAMPRIYLTGEIMRDDIGALKRICWDAKKIIEMPFSSFNELDQELEKYALWNMWKSLRVNIQERRIHKDFLYYYLLGQTLHFYVRFLQVEVLNVKKLDRILTDRVYRESYLYEEIPDTIFVDLFVTCLKEVNLETLDLLLAHVWEKSGGFDPEHWYVQTSLS